MVKACAEFGLGFSSRGGPAQGHHPASRMENLGYDSPDGQYGRPSTFYQQLQTLNLKC